MAEPLRSISNGIESCKQSIDVHMPCFKHAAENLSQKTKPETISGDKLCKGCSRTMLSYIFLIQDMLDSLAKKFSKDEDSSCCVQCLRLESRHAEDLQSEKNFENDNLKNEDLKNMHGIPNGDCEPTSSSEPQLQQESQTSQEQKSDVSPTVTNTVEVTSQQKSQTSQEQESDVSPTVEVTSRQESDVCPTVTDRVEVTSGPKRPRKVSSRRNSRRISRAVKESGNNVYSENCVSRNGWQTDFLYNVCSSIEPKYTPYGQEHKNSEDLNATALNKRNDSREDIFDNLKEMESLISHISRSDSLQLIPGSPALFFDNLSPSPKTDFVKSPEHMEKIYKENNSTFESKNVEKSARCDNSASESTSYPCKSAIDDLSKPDYSNTEKNLDHLELEDSAKSDCSCTESNLSHFEADVDDSSMSDHSGTESVEREVISVGMKHADRNERKWRPLFDSFSDHVAAGVVDRESSEAFVTICRNNGEALGCLVLGSSLLLSRTSRELCVLVFDDVDPVFKEPLSTVFHVVQHVRNRKSVDENNPEYLKQMKLEKLNVWCLIQYSKCVFLNPDCLILRNCDELFQHEELSAVSDIGWPDCFNAGVFVFTPSVDTLSKLVELSKKQGQNNGGDQLLLNAYFSSWSSDMGKKLSFIYNLMRNASYTYGPAFQRFGHNIRIVQFLGDSKPWEAKFSSQTGQLDGNADIHPKHVRFLSEWINVFKIAVLKLLPQEAYTYAFTQRSLSAEDIGHLLRSPARPEDSDPNAATPERISPQRQTASTWCSAAAPGASFSAPAPAPDGSAALPGASVGDYQGMRAWERGQIDYEGCDSSENIMNRLSFLIRHSV